LTVCSSRKSLAEEESCPPASSGSCTGLHAECLWVGMEGDVQVEVARSFSPSSSWRRTGAVLYLLVLLVPFARKSWSLLVPSFLLAYRSPGHRKATTSTGTPGQALVTILPSAPLPPPPRVVPPSCLLVLGGSSGEPLAPPPAPLRDL